MIGHEENQEDVTFKVTDRRKFNPDGSVREGVIIDEPKPAPQQQPQQPAEQSAAAAPARADVADVNPTREMVEPLDDDLEGEDIPGAEDPASFINFLSTLATNAAASLGAMPHPATGQRAVNLDTGKYWLDVLGMLRDKTNGNLHPQEARLLEGLLADLRMQYVTMVRATEDKLKAQAAKKFSADDLLGKR